MRIGLNRNLRVFRKTYKRLYSRNIINLHGAGFMVVRLLNKLVEDRVS